MYVCCTVWVPVSLEPFWTTASTCIDSWVRISETPAIFQRRRSARAAWARGRAARAPLSTLTLTGCAASCVRLCAWSQRRRHRGNTPEPPHRHDSRASECTRTVSFIWSCLARMRRSRRRKLHQSRRSNDLSLLCLTTLNEGQQQRRQRQRRQQCQHKRQRHKRQLCGR